MKIQNNSFLSIEQLTDRYLKQDAGITVNKQNTAAPSFKELLTQKSEEGQIRELRFSKHAMGRLNERNISLDTGQMERLTEGARKAQQKGIRDSLVIVDQLAFIVNVPNQTVVTAMDSTQTEDSIFTNINGAVIM